MTSYSLPGTHTASLPLFLSAHLPLCSSASLPLYPMTGQCSLTVCRLEHRFRPYPIKHEPFLMLDLCNSISAVCSPLVCPLFSPLSSLLSSLFSPLSLFVSLSAFLQLGRESRSVLQHHLLGPPGTNELPGGCLQFEPCTDQSHVQRHQLHPNWRCATLPHSPLSLHILSLGFDTIDVTLQHRYRYSLTS